MDLFHEPLNEQDRSHLEATVEKIDLDRVREPFATGIKRLHPTLKKCACGFVGTKHLFHKHLDTLRFAARSGGEDPKIFYTKHGEVPLNEEL